MSRYRNVRVVTLVDVPPESCLSEQAVEESLDAVENVGEEASGEA